MEKEKRSSFSGSLGFVLAAAGSAVGLGNLWRFPTLAAKNGGGLFLAVYIILSLTFGFALLVTEIAIGRKTGKSPLLAYRALDRRFSFLGVIASVIPALIFPYYCAIGGWVTKYAATYVTGGASNIEAAGAKEYFFGFIADFPAPMIWFFVFMAITAAVVLLGVEKGIEKASKIMMPALVLIIIGISVYSLTLSHTDESGVTRTAWEGFLIYIVPNFEGMTVGSFATLLLDAVGQMFFSMSIAMGIMITYGSYCKKDQNLVKSVNHIELFDTGVAILAGLVVVPSVFVFQGMDGLSAAGPSLMFVSLPEVFTAMGFVGNIVGAFFFVLVFVAALTSSISLLETVASSLIDAFGLKRPVATAIAFLFSLAVGIFICLGYNVFYADIPLPNGETGQLLDLFDYIASSLMLPLVALITAVFVGWILKPKTLTDEIENGLDGTVFRRKGLYTVMIKYIAPVLLFLLILQAFNVFSFLG